MVKSLYTYAGLLHLHQRSKLEDDCTPEYLHLFHNWKPLQKCFVEGMTVTLPKLASLADAAVAAIVTERDEESLSHPASSGVTGESSAPEGDVGSDGQDNIARISTGSEDSPRDTAPHSDEAPSSPPQPTLSGVNMASVPGVAGPRANRKTAGVPGTAAPVANKKQRVNVRAQNRANRVTSMLYDRAPVVNQPAAASASGCVINSGNNVRHPGNTSDGSMYHQLLAGGYLNPLEMDMSGAYATYGGLDKAMGGANIPMQGYGSQGHETQSSSAGYGGVDMGVRFDIPYMYDSNTNSYVVDPSYNYNQLSQQMIHPQMNPYPSGTYNPMGAPAPGSMEYRHMLVAEEEDGPLPDMSVSMYAYTHTGGQSGDAVSQAAPSGNVSFAQN